MLAAVVASLALGAPGAQAGITPQEALTDVNGWRGPAHIPPIATMDAGRVKVRIEAAGFDREGVHYPTSSASRRFKRPS